MVDQGVYPFGSLAQKIAGLALSGVLREQNQLDEALQRVNWVIARMQDWNMPTDRIFASLALIHILEAQGENRRLLRNCALPKTSERLIPCCWPWRKRSIIVKSACA